MDFWTQTECDRLTRAGGGLGPGRPPSLRLENNTAVRLVLRTQLSVSLEHDVRGFFKSFGCAAP